MHVAIAAVNGIDYLLTWNLRHLANAVIRGKIEEAVRKAGLVPPVICTPEELMERVSRRREADADAPFSDASSTRSESQPCCKPSVRTWIAS